MEYSTMQYSLYLTDISHLSDQGLHLQSIYREVFLYTQHVSLDFPCQRNGRYVPELPQNIVIWNNLAIS